jgi:hypothetical protein
MAKSTEERLEDSVRSCGEVASELTDGQVTRLTIDFQASGELPFRLEIPNETLPLVGMARQQSPRDDTGDSSASVAVDEWRGEGA